jgi:hypothetical protein
MKAKRMYYKMALIAVFLLTSYLFSATSILASTDFSDSNLWEIVMVGSGFNATANTTQLNVTIPTDSLGNAGVLSKFTISGDFDIRANYSLGIWPSNNGIELEFGFSKSNGDLIAGVGRSDLNANAYGSEIIYPGNDMMNSVATTDMSGALRITRFGDTITCYYWNGTWQPLLFATDAALAQDGIVDLMGWESLTPNVGTASVTFSDYSQVPIPSSLLLLSGGLLGLGLPRLRRRMKKS